MPDYREVDEDFKTTKDKDIIDVDDSKTKLQELLKQLTII